MGRRFWLGVALLEVFLVLGLLTTRYMAGTNEPVARKLEQAAQAALEGDLQEGVALTNAAKDQWERHRNVAAVAADHEPMEEIDSLFAQVEAYGRIGAVPEFTAYCARLSKLVEAVGEAHGLTWWNLL